MLLRNSDENAPEEGKRLGWFADFKEFTTETTSHGIKYVFHATYKWVKAIYLVLWLLAVGYTIYIVLDSIMQYASMQTGTKIEQRVMPTVEGLNQPAITHPTITVCPHNMVSKAYLNKHTGLEDVFSAFHTWGHAPVNFSAEPASNLRDMTYHQVIEGGQPRLHLLQCSHYRHYCHEIDPFKSQNTTHWEWEVTLSGSCIRINPRGEIYTQAGDYGLLKLFFFADIKDYSDFAKLEPQYGYIVTFHDNGTYSSTATSGFFMSPGNVYKADLRKIVEINMGPPAGHCNPHHRTNVYGTYSANSCTMKCRDDYVYKNCSCVQIKPPRPDLGIDGDKYQSCTLEQWAKCGMAAQVEWVDKFVNLTNDELLCNCPKACKEIHYEATISSSRLSKSYAESRVTKLPLKSIYNTTEDVYENIMVLDVLFTSIHESQYKEYRKYTFNDLIGSVGGQMGMLLGASMFTVIEFIHFFVKACWRYCLRQGNGGRPVQFENAES